MEHPPMSIPALSSTEPNQHQDYTEYSQPPRWGRLSDARTRRLCRGLWPVKLGWQLRETGLRWIALWHQLLSEMRSLLCRMALQYKRRDGPYILTVDLRRPTDQEGGLRLSIRRHACIADIENFVASRPWATMIDWEVYRDAWAKGAEWADDSYHKSKPEGLS